MLLQSRAAGVNGSNLQAIHNWRIDVPLLFRVLMHIICEPFIRNKSKISFLLQRYEYSMKQQRKELKKKNLPTISGFSSFWWFTTGKALIVNSSQIYAAKLQKIIETAKFFSRKNLRFSNFLEKCLFFSGKVLIFVPKIRPKSKYHYQAIETFLEQW